MDRKTIPPPHSTKVFTALVPCVCSSAVTIIYRAQVPQRIRAGTEIIDLVDYAVTVTEPEDRIVRSTATATNRRDYPLAPVTWRSTSCPDKTASKLERLKERKSKVLANKIAKAKGKKKKGIASKRNRFCKRCKVSCNCNKTFYDHCKSRTHRNFITNLKSDLHCELCDRDFKTRSDLETHNVSGGHVKSARLTRQKAR